MEITVKIKSVYGTEYVYPVCDKALLFARIAGKKTLSRTTIESIKELGYSVTVETSVL